MEIHISDLSNRLKNHILKVDPTLRLVPDTNPTLTLCQPHYQIV
jgi:hypothetical protein